MAPQSRSGDPDVDALRENTADQRAAPYHLRRSARTDPYRERSVPPSPSDPDGEPHASEDITPSLKAYLSARILAGVCAAAVAAVLAALLSSNAAWDAVVNVKASMAAVLAAPSSAAQSVSAGDDARPAASGVANPVQRRVPSAPELRSVSTPSTLAPPTPLSKRKLLDTAEIVTMMKGGAEFMANGNVAAARMMFRPAAEAGDAAAAFALAETYDPLVLANLGAKGGIVPDVALAQRWYAKANELGYSASAR